MGTEEQTSWQKVHGIWGHGSLVKRGLGENTLGLTEMLTLSAMVSPSWVYERRWDAWLVDPWLGLCSLYLLSEPCPLQMPSCSVIYFSPVNFFEISCIPHLWLIFKSCIWVHISDEMPFETENPAQASFCVCLYTKLFTSTFNGRIISCFLGDSHAFNGLKYHKLKWAVFVSYKQCPLSMRYGSFG